jgi:osmoprotectant transport system ATP-binding protein
MIRLESVTKRYPGGHVAVESLDLDVPDGETCVLVGPSGCGKTTTLKMINRLVEPSAGRILLDGEDVTGADPVHLRRRMGYVIQQIGLFPHLTVAANVGVVPRLAGWDRSRITRRVDELLDLVGLDPGRYGHRYPDQLSGGQRQRVGVARALGVDPPVLLMDEPFGSLDPITRDRLQTEFCRLQQEVRKTVVFVTHDIDEAVKLGDRIAILRQGGVLEQYGTPADVLGRPATEFVADFVGADRGLKRLQVTRVAAADLQIPPVAHVDDAVAEVRWTLESAGADFAVVLDHTDSVRGWLPRSRAGGDGEVGPMALPVPVSVDADASLKDALSQMLLGDAGWVAVERAGRFAGVLTPDALHAALRRSVGHDDLGSGEGQRQEGPAAGDCVEAAGREGEAHEPT